MQSNRPKIMHVEDSLLSYMYTLNSIDSIPLCIKPSLENGDYVGPHEGPNYQQGTYISAVCLPGYELEGTTIRRRCRGIDGTDDWSGQNPECIRGQVI